MAWRSSGLSKPKFVADKGFAHQSLQRWAAKFRDEKVEPVGLPRVTRPGVNDGLALEASGV